MIIDIRCENCNFLLAKQNGDKITMKYKNFYSSVIKAEQVAILCRRCNSIKIILDKGMANML